MRSFFSKKTSTSSGAKSTPETSNPLDKTAHSTPQSLEAKDSSDETIDLSTDPHFIAVSEIYDEELNYHSEVPIKVILDYLKPFEGTEKMKKADAVLQELAGLMRDVSNYKNNTTVLRAMCLAIKKYSSPNIAKYVNTIRARCIRPDHATILPTLFEDLENAFLGFSLDKVNKRIQSEVKDRSHSRSNKM